MKLEDQLRDIVEKARHFSALNIIDVKLSGGYTFDMYIALEKSDRARGLLGINELDVDGMLFCYSSPTTAAFTMNGMSMDLDIAWFDKNGKRLQSGSFSKDHTDPIHCFTEYSYVIEMPKGTLPQENDLVVSNGS